ncbi:phosphotransferase family protein [Catenulispora pinisilvae]|uniref:phosphotransferase family protein n=1 Tax=Catenulispora pinisilvae TaxID=2705253 RepID=UPI001891F46C|nr:aminoglycoside phosphotransferase family protein [Catenulispora pinisilvae]
MSADDVAERQLAGGPMALAVARLHGLSSVRILARGIESQVWRATSEQYGQVVVKLPVNLSYENVNDPGVELSTLFRQEQRLAAHLHRHGFSQVPRAFVVDELDGHPFMISEYIESDAEPVEGYEVGRALAALHKVPPPEFATSAQEGLPASRLVPHRINRRVLVFNEITGESLPIPSVEEMTAVLLEVADDGHLLHLDVRSANLRRSSRRPVVVLDWSNSLVGPVLLELARSRQIGDIAGDELEAGYRSVAGDYRRSEAAELIFRLDAAVMLALVFLSEAPDPAAAKVACSRAAELATELRTVL